MQYQERWMHEGGPAAKPCSCAHTHTHTHTHTRVHAHRNVHAQMHTSTYTGWLLSTSVLVVHVSNHIPWHTDESNYSTNVNTGHFEDLFLIQYNLTILIS